MSENSNIYNIFSRLSNSNNIKEDLNEALCLIKTLQTQISYTNRTRYSLLLTKLCIRTYKGNNITKACKPFTNDKGNIDNMINIINTVRTFNHICNGI